MSTVKGTWWQHTTQNTGTIQRHTLMFRNGFNGAKSFPNWERYFVTFGDSNGKIFDSLVNIHTNSIAISKGSSTEIVTPQLVCTVGNAADNSRLKGFFLMEITFKQQTFRKWFEFKTGVPLVNGDSPGLTCVGATPVQSVLLNKLRKEFSTSDFFVQMGKIDGLWKDSGLIGRDGPLLKLNEIRKPTTELAEELRKKLKYAETRTTFGTFSFRRIGPAGVHGGKKTMAHCLVPGFAMPVIDLKLDTTFESKGDGRLRLRSGRYIVDSDNGDLSQWYTVQIQGTFTRASSAIGTAEKMKISKKSKMQTNAFKRI